MYISGVFQSVWTPSAKQYIELETLAAQIISPLMTARGVYYDGKVTPAPQPKNLKKAKSSGKVISQKYLIESRICLGVKYSDQRCCHQMITL